MYQRWYFLVCSKLDENLSLLLFIAWKTLYLNDMITFLWEEHNNSCHTFSYERKLSEIVNTFTSRDTRTMQLFGSSFIFLIPKSQYSFSGISWILFKIMNASMTKNKWIQFQNDFLLHFEYQVSINPVSMNHLLYHTHGMNFDTIEYFVGKCFIYSRIFRNHEIILTWK